MINQSETATPKKSTVVMAALGIMVVLAHLIAAIWFGMSASNWMGGASIGLILVMVATAHIMIPGHIRNRVVNMNQQYLYWLVAGALGLVAGLVGSLLYSSMGWVIIILGVVSAMFIGRQLTGNPKTKTIRLGIYGFVASLVFFNINETVKSRSPSEIFTYSLFAGVLTILTGLVVHLTLGPKAIKQK